MKGVRAAFADAQEEAVGALVIDDPPPDQPRMFEIAGKKVECQPGQWPGAPVDRMPPGSLVVPLGVDGQLSYFVDALGQILAFDGLDKKRLIKLFRLTPNGLYFYWPRWSAPTKTRPPQINGLEVDEAVACLEKAAGERGLFATIDRVRGRGAWTDDFGRLIWHSGDALWRMDGKKLTRSAPGEIDGMFYPRRPMTMTPWREPVDPADSPAQAHLNALLTWSWQRGALDAVILIGLFGCMMIGGALHWRPHGFITGDMKVGKTELQRLTKALIGSALHDCGNTSEAGVRQRLGLDTLPVACDEMEASEDNRRVMAIIELARLASSGARLFRGGADHKGIEFQARSSFLMSGIIPPPMKPQDRSRFVMLDLGRLTSVGEPPDVGDHDGRMILRALMDAWHDFPRAFGDWKNTLRGAGLDGRAQDTYGTVFAIAELLLGIETLEKHGLPIDDAAALGALIAQATAEERARQTENWRACLEHMLGKTIDAWKGGEKPTIGAVIEQVEHNADELQYAKPKLAAAGVGLVQEGDADLPHGKRKFLLAVPSSSSALAPLFFGTRWSDGGWYGSLKQGRDSGVIRPGDKVVKINRVAARCLLVDLVNYDKLMEGGA